MLELRREIITYLDYCKYQKNLNDKTIKAYSIDLKQFQQQVLKSVDWTAKIGISGYITYLHKTFSPKSAKRKLASVKAFFNYLEFEEIVINNPMSKMKTKFQEPKTLPRAIPLRAVENILNVAYGKIDEAATKYSIKIAQRNVAIIELLFATGVRVSELCNLSNDDVNLDDGNIRIMGKGARERNLQIGNSEVLEALHQYRAAFSTLIHETGCFFVNRRGLRFSEQSVRNLIRNYSQQAGVESHTTPHMFRHSFATLLLEEDVDIRYIQRMLGHSSIQTTQIYTQVTGEKQRHILTTKHPRNKMSPQHR